jgi:hypothetical protein
MTRRRRGRRPGERDAPGQTGQPRVSPDGRHDPRAPRQPGGYTPPASPLTRWQGYGGTGQRGGAGQGNTGRSRWWADAAGARGDRRRFAPNGNQAAPSAPPRRYGEGRPPPRVDDERRAPPRQNPSPSATGAKIDAFDLFCAYHLGITSEGGYRIQNIHEVARRFGTNAAELRQVLTDYGMAADDIVHSGFDLPGAQVDIMVAPEGISRRELARPLYDEFRNAPKQARNWAREMEDAQRQIEETIGRDGRWSPTPRDRTGKQS